MPTKILVIETPHFQLGANAGETAERASPETFPATLKKFQGEGGTDTLFLLAPSDIKTHAAFGEAVNGPASVSVAVCESQQDAIRFLPSLLIFAGGDRAQGVKDCLGDGSTIYSETFFNGKAVGTRLDPCFNFARTRLSGVLATNAWGCLQSLVFLGLQNLPEQGEKGTGEKVDVQIGADDKLVAFTVRFEIKPDQLAALRANPLLTLPRTAAGVFESRFIQAGNKIEFNCLFFRSGGAERPIEITSFHRDAALEDASFVKEYTFKTFAALTEPAPEEKTKVKGKGGFKKKFSEKMAESSPPPATEETKIASDISGPVGSTTVKGAPAAAEAKVVVSGKASLVPDKETVIKNENAANKVLELEAKIQALEHNLKVREEALAKAGAEDPLKKRDVITNIKDSQAEALKQRIKILEEEAEETGKREKELMSMVDKAVQMKDEAAKKIKDLDTKLKQSSGGTSSKVTQLEKQLEEQKRQNKELSSRVTELNNKLKAA